MLFGMKGWAEFTRRMMWIPTWNPCHPISLSYSNEKKNLSHCLILYLLYIFEFLSISSSSDSQHRSIHAQS